MRIYAGLGTHWLSSTLLLAAALAGSACESDEDAPTSASSSSSSGGASGGAGGTGVGGGASSGGAGGQGGDVPTCVLGCRGDQYCDGPDGTCPGGGDPGTCVERPTCRGAAGEPVCGCDGIAYSTPCGAHASGTDIGPEGACTLPPDGFPCGTFLCDGGADLCLDRACEPIPARCVATPDCACIEPIVCPGGQGTCEEDAAGNVVIDCTILP
jgi:hypothetical protein